jgi:hypothetical protein
MSEMRWKMQTDQLLSSESSPSEIMNRRELHVLSPGQNDSVVTIRDRAGAGLIMMRSGSCGELRQSLLSSFPHPLGPIAGADSDDVANLCPFCVQVDQIST